ncbi:NPP1-domain-containing protein [Xylariaceae sp. FL0594]|nr:NPP1-domain-containing protein [Xylariaceae sp. FL0594]
MGFAKSLLFGTAALALTANAARAPSGFQMLVKRDPPAALPACAPDNDKKYQPAMDFDKDGCYNSPAVDGSGNLAGGLPCGGAKNGHCRDESDLDNNNVYSRQRCNNGWCGYLYGYYFEKDQSIDGSCGVGHKNDWEHIVVWVKDGEDMPAYVAVSQHKGWEVRGRDDVRWQDTHPKVVYHQDGGLTHAFRFANEDDDHIENHKGVWFLGGLVSYYGFPNAEIRDSMLNNDWGAALPDIREDVFPGKLEDSKGGNDIPTDTRYDDGSPGQPSC